MGKLSSNVSAILGRIVKVVVVLVVLPLVIGLLQGIRAQLDILSAAHGTFREWVEAGLFTYVGIHVLLYRPAPLFRASHRMFASLAGWLFGGQVASTEDAGGGKGKASKKSKGGSEGGARGSTLVAFSPYAIPLYTVLVCVAGWLLSRWVDRAWLDAPVSFLIGMTMGLHWLMAAEELQQQRERWHIETYLLAISLVFALTLLIGSACLPWGVPEFSFPRALADGVAQAQAIYATIIQQLFL